MIVDSSMSTTVLFPPGVCFPSIIAEMEDNNSGSISDILHAPGFPLILALVAVMGFDFSNRSNARGWSGIRIPIFPFLVMGLSWGLVGLHKMVTGPGRN